MFFLGINQMLMEQKVIVPAIILAVALGLFTSCSRSAPGGGPPIPSGLAATAPLETQVALSWTEVSDATGYSIYRGTNIGGENLQQHNVPAPTFEDSGLRDGTTYYYKVTAINRSGESARSVEASVTTKAPTPMNLQATAADSRIILNWSASATATNYRVYRDTLGGVGGATNFWVRGSSFTDTGLVNGTSYFYELGAINVDGENYHSVSTASATPAPASFSEAPAGVPAEFTASAGNCVIFLRWLPVSNASTYNLYRGAGSHTEMLWQTGIVTTTFADRGLTNGANYFYQIRAVNAEQSGPLSGEISATPYLPTVPANLTAQAGSHQVVLTWTGQGTSYAVYRGTNSGSETLLDSGLIGNCFTDAGLVNGAPYFYKIQCLNAGGSSSLSTEISAVPSGPAPQPWSGIVHFGLPGEPVQSCVATIPDLNRPVQLALLTAEGPNLRALASKYNAITLALDGFTPFNFGPSSHPVYLTTADDDHPVAIIDYRWPELSAQRIQAALNAATLMVPSHPEIKNTGLILYGFSEGTINVNLALSQPALVNRVLAAVLLSEIDEDRYHPLVTMTSAPHLFLASGLKDVYSSLNLGMEDFSAVTHDAFSRGLATTQGAPLTVLNNVGARHGGNPDHPFISLWLDSVLSQRLPATLPVSAPVSLLSWQMCSSWVGYYDVTSNSAAPWNSGVQTINNLIAPKSLCNDPRPFTWLPGQKAAVGWLAYANTGKLTAVGPGYFVPSKAEVTMERAFRWLKRVIIRLTP
jgi:fibronectin type 3 domain-containing protein